MKGSDAADEAALSALYRLLDARVYGAQLDRMRDMLQHGKWLERPDDLDRVENMLSELSALLGLALSDAARFQSDDPRPVQLGEKIDRVAFLLRITWWVCCFVGEHQRSSTVPTPPICACSIMAVTVRKAQKQASVRLEKAADRMTVEVLKSNKGAVPAAEVNTRLLKQSYEEALSEKAAEEIPSTPTRE